MKKHKLNSNKNEFFKFKKFYLDFLYLGDKTIDFEARIVEGDKTLLLGDLDIVPKKFSIQIIFKFNTCFWNTFSNIVNSYRKFGKFRIYDMSVF